MAEKRSPTDLVDAAERAFQRFRQYHQLCQAIAEIFYPERADFTAAPIYGAELYRDIFDGEPILLRAHLANQLGVMLRRRGEDWFRCKAFPRQLNEIDGVKYWTEDATGVLREVIYAPSAMFSKSMNEGDNDYVAFGSAVLQQTYNRDATGLLFRTGHLRDHAWHDNAEGKVDEMNEKMKKPISQWRQLFGEKATFPDTWRKLEETNKHAEVPLMRVVTPIEAYAHGKDVSKASAKFASCYVDPDSKTLVAEAGFSTFPYTVRRWMSVSGEPWGRSPCTGVAMADARLLNRAQISIIEGMEKVVNKPMFAPHDGVVGNVQIKPGGVSYYDPEAVSSRTGKPIDVIDVSEPRAGIEFAQERRQFMGRAFFSDLASIPADHEMTAFEYGQRLEETVRRASPLLEPMENEHSEVLDASFERALTKGAFAELPKELEGAEVRFELTTFASITRQKVEASKATAVVAFVRDQVELNPGVVDLVDWDEMDRAALPGIGADKWVRSREDVEADRQARQQAQQAQQVAALAAQAAGIEQQKNKMGLGLPAPPGASAPSLSEVM